ncbi:MAG: 6-phosphogluconolactonase [Candidatus Tectimicrobiota bacterium]
MSSLQREIRRCDDATALAQQTAEAFVRVAQASVAARGRFTVALAGGSTPKAAFALLASAAYREHVPWQHIHVFWGDERHVPPDHADSNYRMAHESMLAHVPIPAAHIHRILSEQEAHKAAEAYTATLQQAFGLRNGELPRFDLILLGMGPDGHTASLFPGTSAVHERTQLVVAPWVEKFHTFRITMSPPVLCNAEHVVFAAGGADKAETLQQVLEGPYNPDMYPSQVVQPTHGTLLWLVDQAAARLLS